MCACALLQPALPPASLLGPCRIKNLNALTDAGTLIHELGHNFGLGHADSQDVLSGLIHPTGDVADLMGGGGSPTVADFSGGFKHAIGWIPHEAVLTLSPPTTTEGCVACVYVAVRALLCAPVPRGASILKIGLA